jgi:signal transduction histidine kinase
MPASFTTKQNRFFIALVVLSALSAMLSFYLLEDSIKAAAWVRRALDINTEARQALTCLMDCETGYRGYLITGEDEYLQPYENCYRHLSVHLEALKKLTADNTDQQTLVAELDALAKEKIAFSQSVIEARRKDPKAPARDLVTLAPGKKIMDQFRHKIDALVDDESNVLSKRRTAVQKKRENIFFALAALSLCTVAAIITLHLNTKQFIRRQEEAQNQIKSALEEAIRARATAESANQLKSEFVSTVSHEVRTPMAGVIGIVELLTQEQLSDEQQEMVNRLFYASKRLLSVLNDLLDFSKLQSGKTTVEYVMLSPQEICSDILFLFRPIAEKKGIQLHDHIDENLPKEICGDEHKIRQLLNNLVDNAIKFTDKGTVDFGIQLVTRENDKLTIRFSVKDTGVGIAKDKQQRLFSPFVQADGSTTRRYGGTGLGLSICKQYVELMGGSIGLNSEANQGSEFWFTLPSDISSESPCRKS